MKTPDQLKKSFSIDVYPETEAINIDRKNKEVLANSKDRQEMISYDKLIISSCEQPLIPAIESLAEATNVYMLRNDLHVDKLLATFKYE